MAKVLENSFLPIKTLLTPMDIEELCYDWRNLDEDEFKQIANEMTREYVRDFYWRSLKKICEKHGLKRIYPECENFERDNDEDLFCFGSEMEH